MKTLRIPGFITTRPAEDWRAGDPEVFDGMAYRFQTYEPVPDGGVVIVCKHELVVEVPAGFDPRPQQIKALKAQEQKLREEFSTRVAQIHRAISELQAIEYTPA